MLQICGPDDIQSILIHVLEWIAPGEGVEVVQLRLGKGVAPRLAGQAFGIGIFRVHGDKPRELAGEAAGAKIPKSGFGITFLLHKLVRVWDWSSQILVAGNSKR